jgi:hypothetical protein
LFFSTLYFMINEMAGNMKNDMLIMANLCK